MNIPPFKYLLAILFMTLMVSPEVAVGATATKVASTSKGASEEKPDGAAPVVDPSATREMIHQWVMTEGLISEEKSAWQVEKAQMQELLDLYQKELKLLDEEISQAGNAAELVDERQETYKKELKAYRDAQRVLKESLSRLLPRIQRLLPQLPASLQKELAGDMETLKAADALQHPRDVMKSMISVMSAAGRFNRSITLTEETRTLPGGKKVLVDVIYLGLARAYYATGAGDTAGVGRPGAIGWQWDEQPEIAGDVRKAIAVYRKESQPKLIKLPISLSEATPNNP